MFERKMMLATFLGMTVLGAMAEENLIKITQSDGKVQEVLLTPQKNNNFRFYRSIWQAVQLKTNGKTINITDPLFYTITKDGKNAGYWTDPKNWDSQLSFTSLGKISDGGEALCIEGKRDGYVKQVFLAVYPKENAVYVVNRLKVEQAGRYADIQLMYLNLNQSHPDAVGEIVLDDKAIPLDKQANAKQSTVLYLEKNGVTIGVFAVPKQFRKDKLGKNGALFTFDAFPEKKSGQIKISGLYDNVLNKDEIIEIKYAILWDDGMKIDEFAKFSQKLQNGELNHRFYSN